MMRGANNMRLIEFILKELFNIYLCTTVWYVIIASFYLHIF